MRPRRIPYSAAELAFVKARHAMRRDALHAAFVREFGRSDVTMDHIKGLCSRKGWTTRERWTRAEEAVLRELYANTKTELIARRLGRSLTTVFQHARKLGLEKSPEYLESPSACRLRRGDNVGAEFRFKKGQVPFNKGLRRPGWSPGRMKETQFQKGVRQGVATKLYKPIGTERLSKEGYLERKIHDGMPQQSRWRTVQRIRWEEINGPVPSGMVLKNLDGDRLNTDPSNWALIPRAMLPLLSGRHRLSYDEAPAELKPTLLAIAQLQAASNAADGLTATQRMIRKRKLRSA